MTPKKLAQQRGDPTYIGNPCSHCGRKTRYTSNSHCLYCRSQRTKRTDLKCTTAICDENSSEGSVFCVEHARISKMLIRVKKLKAVYDDSVWLWPERLLMIGRVCVYCGGSYDHLDHVIPLGHELKGPHTLFNFVPGCWECNLFKGNKMPHEAWPERKQWPIYVIEPVQLFHPELLTAYISIND